MDTIEASPEHPFQAYCTTLGGSPLSFITICAATFGGGMEFYMKKLLSFALSLCILLMGGCVENNNDDYPDSFIPFAYQNIFTLNFNELYKEITNRINAKDNNVSMPFMYEKPAIDILFTPEGEIMSLEFSLYALLEDSTEYNYIMGEYRVINNHNTDANKKQSIPESFTASASTMTGLDVYCQEKGEYGINVFKDTFNFKEFPSFMEWITALDLRTILEKYTVDSPIRYQFLSSPLLAGTVNNPDVNIIYLEYTSSGVNLIQRPETSVTANYYKIDGKQYYTIIPYYLQDGTIKGINELELGQTEDEKMTYIANNIIVLFID